MFIAGTHEIEFANESLHLLPDRAIYWPARSTLLVADVHFGKCATFRSLGVPVPAGGAQKDLLRLSTLIGQTSAQRVVILGDLLHARAGRSPEIIDAISAWRRAHSLIQVVLVRGNHDRSSGHVPDDWNVQEVDEEFNDDGVILTHAPPCNSDLPTFAGHVHPTVHLQDFDGSLVTAPCFVFDKLCATLPAFGTFTGGHPVRPEPGRRLFLVAPGRVVPLSTRQKTGV